MAPKDIIVLIFHNENERNSFIHGYAVGDPLKLVYEGHHRLPYREDAEVSLEYIFEQNQHGVSGVYPWYERGRSLCCGDVVVLDKRAWSINRGVGFTEIDPAEAGIQELVSR